MVHQLFGEDFLRKLQLLELNFRRRQARHLEGRFTSLPRGGRVEFADHRTYTTGDDLRYIDWKLYARTDRFFIKEFRKEEQPHAVLLLDASGSMSFGQPSKWDFARQVAAAIAFIALANHAGVQTATFADGLSRWWGPARNRSGLAPTLDFLRCSGTGGDTSVGAAIGDLVARQHRPCLVVLLSDLMDRQDPRGTLGVLAAKGFDLTVIHVLSPEELQPPWAGPRVLIDAESRRRRRLVLDGRVTSLYLQQLHEFREGWRRFCASHQMLYLPASTATPFDELLLHYLRRGGLLR